LLSAVEYFVKDPLLVNLIRGFIKTDIRDDSGKSYAGLNIGIPQGCSPSPILLNMYLHQFDHKMDHLLKSYPIRYARYADDLLVAFCTRASQPTDSKSIEEVHQCLLSFIQDEELELKVQTKRVGEPFIFLGMRVSIFQRNTGLKRVRPLKGAK
jgi:hypothetical protein